MTPKLHIVSITMPCGVVIPNEPEFDTAAIIKTHGDLCWSCLQSRRDRKTPTLNLEEIQAIKLEGKTN